MTNDTYTFLGPDVTPLKIFEIDRHTWQPGDAIRIDGMLTEVGPELAKRRAALEATEQLHQQYGRNLAEVDDTTAQMAEAIKALLTESMHEVIATGPACDSLPLGSRLRLLQDKLELLKEARNLLTYRLIPGERLRHRKDMLALREIEHLEARLLADHSEATTLEALSEVFDAEGRVALIGEKTSALREIEAECKRQVALAKEALRTERNKQGEVEQRRLSMGQLTRAELAVQAVCYE